MPPRRTANEHAENEGSGTQAGTDVALASMMDEVRADLLKAQAASIQTPPTLKRIKVMAAGVGMFEFEGAETVRSFRGVILGNHPRNLLWDRKFGEAAPSTGNEEQDALLKMPACSSSDAKYGTPRVGFVHAALGRPAVEGDRIACGTCPYNKFGTGALLIPTNNPKGKATTNQRSVYVLLEGESVPQELVLSPSGGAAELDEYMTTLLGRGIPSQAVLTEFSQVIKQKPNTAIKWGVVKFANVGELDMPTFQHVLEKRKEFAEIINPSTVPQTTTATVVTGDGDSGVYEGDNDIPF